MGGNVGIGTTSPGRAVSIYKASTPVLQLINSTTGSADSDGFLLTQSGLDSYLENTEAGNMYFRTSANNRMTINSSGSVGIGTVSPGTLLHVYQDSASSLEVLFENDGAGQSGLTLRSDRGSNGNLIGFVYFDGNDNGSNNTRYNSIESYIVDSSNGTEDGRLTASSFVDGTDTEILHVMGYGGEGRVGISTTTPGSRLEVKDSQDSSLDSGIGITRSASSQTGYINMVGGAFNFNAPSAIPIKFRDGGTTYKTILGDGNVGIGTTSPSVKLEVAGTFKVSDWGHFSNSGGNEIVLGSSGANYGFIMNPSAGVWS